MTDTRLHIVERGDGRGYPLICVHGGPGLDHHTFADYLDPLAPEVRVILFDLRAHGLSDDAPAATLTLPQFATDVVELAAVLGLGEYAVLGHSFGGSVALRLAVDHPTAASALVLSAATPSPVALPSGEERLAHVSLQLHERLAQADTYLDWFHAYIAACFADEHDERVNDYLQRRAGMVVRAETAERMSTPSADELRDRLSEVRPRTLVLHGRYDRNTPLTLGEQLAHGIPDAKLVVFERSGHFPFVEEQEAYLRAIRRFLRPARAGS